MFSPLLECLQGQGAHYHVWQLLTKMRGICFHDFRLPPGPHAANLLPSKLDLQILTLSPLGEKTSLELKHQVEEFSSYVDIAGLGYSLGIFLISVILGGATD